MNGKHSTMKDWLTMAVMMLDDVAVILVAWIVLNFLNISVPLPLAITLITLWLAQAFFRQRAVIPLMREDQITGARKMVGLEGKVIAPLYPDGSIKVRGEYWKATSVDGGIESDQHVEVVDVQGLRLLVKKRAD